MKSYVRVMDNLPELEKLFETTQAEGATRYRDIADQHEKDLATISQRIKALTPSGDADGVTREAALIRTDFLNKVLVVRNDYEKRLAAGTAGSRTDAARTLMDLTLQANEAGKKIGRSIDITEAVGSALNAIYADADKVTKEGLETILTMNKTLALTNLGLDLAKLDEKNATQMGNYAIYQRRLSELNMAAIDIFSEEGITEADVKTRLNDIAARMWGEKDKYLKQTIQDTIRDSAGADRIAALQDAVSGGTLDDVVNRLDPSGEIAIFSDIKTNLGVLRARQSQTIASVLKLTPEEVLQAGRWVTTKNGDIGADQHYFIGGREYRTIGNPKAATGLTVQFLIRDKTKGDTWANLVQGQTPEIVEQMHVLGGPGAVLRGAPAAKQGTIERLNEEQAKRLAPDDTLNAFEKIAKEQAEKQQKAQAKDAADLERQKALERLNASGGMRVK